MSWFSSPREITSGLLPWLGPDGGCNPDDFRALLLDRSRKFGRGAGACNNTKWWQPIADCGIFHDCSNISGNAVAKLRWHVLPAEESRHTIEREITISDLSCGRNIGRQRLACPVEEGQECCPAGLYVAQHLCERRGHHLDSAFAKVRKGWVEVAIRHICHLDARRFQESSKRKIRDAGGGGPIEFGRARSCMLHQVRQRTDLQLCGCRNNQEIVGRG